MITTGRRGGGGKGEWGGGGAGGSGGIIQWQEVITTPITRVSFVCCSGLIQSARSPSTSEGIDCPGRPGTQRRKIGWGVLDWTTLVVPYWDGM